MTRVARTESPRADSPNGVNPTRLAPGDVVRGRILHVSNDGQTIIQLGPCKVTCDQAFAGRPGDKLLFEILPSPMSAVDGQKRGAPLMIRLLENTRVATHASGRGASELAAPLKLHPPGRAAPHTPSTPLTSENQENVQGPATLVTSVKQLMETMRALSRRWFHPARRRLATGAMKEEVAARLIPQARIEARAASKDRRSASANRNVNRTADSTWDYASGFKVDADREDNGRAQIKVRTAKTGRPDTECGTLTATVALDLENTGRIEVDMQFNAKLLRVVFRVASEALGETIRGDIGRMHTALNHLAPEVYCQVRVDKHHDLGDRLNHAAAAGKQGIDCMI